MTQFTPKQYLQMDIASMYGLDKKTWSERLEWFNQNQNKLEDLVEQADDKAGYIAAVNAYEDMQDGKPIGYCINLDATASGCQVLALLTGDKQAAERVNLINTGKREDLYTYIYNKMKDEVEVSDKLTRDQVKKAIMTSLYGSEKKPKEVFGEDNYEIFEDIMSEELPGVWELNECLLDCWNSKASEYNWIMPDNFHVKCKVMTPVVFETTLFDEPVDILKYVNKPIKKGKFLSANLAHSVDGFINREMTLRCMLSGAYKQTLKKLVNLKPESSEFGQICESLPKGNSRKFNTLMTRYRESGYLPVRILLYLNQKCYMGMGAKEKKELKELVNSLPNDGFELFSIHDCFRCHPNHAEAVREQYRVICSRIAKSKMLDAILSHMFEHPIHVNKLNENLGDEVLKSEYAIC